MIRKRKCLSDNIRCSIGTAAILNITDNIIVDTDPTTAYLLEWHDGKCNANCAFCSQAKTAITQSDQLSRITWPKFAISEVLEGFKSVDSSSLKRVCIQCLYRPNSFENLCSFLEQLTEFSSLPISVCIQPIEMKKLHVLRHLGVERVGIPLDAATPEIFSSVKGENAQGPYRWENHLTSLQNAITVFGKGNVTTHLIVGLGESEQQALRFIDDMKAMGVLTGLFAFTPIKGTRYSDKQRPLLKSYRRVQLGRYLILNGEAKSTEFEYTNDGRIKSYGTFNSVAKEVARSGKPFQTPGCPSCNRPFYNERPSGPLYNYPRNLTTEEKEIAAQMCFPNLSGDE